MADQRYEPWSYTHEELAAMVPTPRPEDVASPEAIVRALHESVNGPQGPWNSDRLRSLCLPNVLFAYIGQNEQGLPVVNNRPLDTFIKDVQEVHDQTGWYERITKIISVSKVDKKGGALAVVHYAGIAAKTPGGEPEEEGETQAILMHDGQRWWVVSDTW
ncbi:hypothetical protein LWC34_46660 [Kibdelosporangium philippinense]|uniref:DUF4440 domain-containing protein n=1 Tax=Kibdelosporangium philippinense TaxID=211113 RepID=A0ABS8ZR53_9PSEU|nr:hypothetical protein [Kibdelosporangium philippinense]MCE7010238.1 hypothetical protein [Kibdelosporangium philippinense]